MALFQSRNITPQKIITYVVLGFGIGSVVGYILMATVHAMLEVRTDSHYGVVTKAQSLPRKMADVKPEVDAGDAELLQQQFRDALLAKRAAKSGTKAVAIPAVKQTGLPTTGDTIHTLCTSNGSPYLNFQNRIMYGTYKLVQKMAGGEKLVAFTRILHRQTPDVIMDEVPTWRANPLHPKCDTWCDFPVADRANAVAQWITAAKADSSLIQAPWLLMIETDYVWLKPLAAPMAESDALPIAFRFGYIDPQNHGIKGVMRKMYPESEGPLSDVPPSGPAPVLMRWQELFKITPEWERLTMHIENDAESREKLGWVREMYAWSVGAALQNVKFNMKLPPACPLIVQPPADVVSGDAAMFHYTWGSIWKAANGTQVWAFDKRFYTDAKFELEVPLLEMPPQLTAGQVMKQQDGIVINQKFVDIYESMIGQMNKAIKTLPILKRTSQQ